MISRQVAIDAIGEIVDTMSVCVSKDECMGMRLMKGLAIDVLNRLPSAQQTEKTECVFWIDTGGNGIPF